MIELDTVVVLTTLPHDVDAAQFARTLVGEHLAACVSIVGEIVSVYRWQDEVCEDHERQLVIKTSRDRIDALEARVRALHPYDVPEFLVLPIAHGSAAYLTWVRGATRP